MSLWLILLIIVSPLWLYITIRLITSAAVRSWWEIIIKPKETKENGNGNGKENKNT